MRVAISTSGGDAPGLNAVIRGATSTALRFGYSVVGIRNGFDGLLRDHRVVPLSTDVVDGIERQGGTILGAISRGNPWEGFEDGPAALKRAMDRQRIDALVLAGGDGSLAIAAELVKYDIRVVVVPKTIDLDVGGTYRTFGFESAVNFATEAMDRLHTTAASHDRLMIVEVMGRDVGWLGLYAGVAGGAHMIAIPEIPYDVEKFAEHMRRREEGGERYHILVCSEGARPVSGVRYLSERTGRYSGVGEALAEELSDLTGKDARAISLGHLLRGGAPSGFDRILGMGFGSAAVVALHDGLSNVMISFRPPHLIPVSIEEAAGRQHRVDPDSHEMQTARNLGICFGD
mgnify:CR=1 FL=1